MNKKGIDVSKWQGAIDWQKSDRGTIDGISGNVDLNEAFKDYPTIMKTKKINGYGANISIDCPASPEVAQNKSEMFYTVKSGDTLLGIAAKYSTTVSEIARINNIKDVNKIYAGQVIKIASQHSEPGEYYTIKSGDTLSAISAKYGIPVEKIAKSNGIKDKNVIYPGQRLKI